MAESTKNILARIRRAASAVESLLAQGIELEDIIGTARAIDKNPQKDAFIKALRQEHKDGKR